MEKLKDAFIECLLDELYQIRDKFESVRAKEHLAIENSQIDDSSKKYCKIALRKVARSFNEFLDGKESQIRYMFEK